MSETKYEILNIDGTEYKTTFTKSHLARKSWEAPNVKHVLSFMPGSVVEYRVKEGETVMKGQSLMLFKAMKMNNNILAPISGKIKCVCAVIGNNVPKGTLLLEFE